MRQPLPATNPVRNLADETLVLCSAKPGNTAQEVSFNGETSFDPLIALFPQDCPVLATRLAGETTAGNLPSVPWPIDSFSDSHEQSHMVFSRKVADNLEVAKAVEEDVRVAGVIDRLMALVEAVQRGNGTGCGEPA